MIDGDKIPYVPAKYFHKGRVKPVQLIVIHSAETNEGLNTAEALAEYCQNPSATVSWHYSVDANSVVQSVYDGNTAFHCKNANANGIGIEHAGRAKQTREQWLDAYGIDMLNISAQIAAYLCRKFDIPVRRAVFAAPDDPRVVLSGFCGHVDVPLHGSHYDPGPGFDWGWYLDRVKQYLHELQING